MDGGPVAGGRLARLLAGRAEPPGLPPIRIAATGPWVAPARAPAGEPPTGAGEVDAGRTGPPAEPARPELTGYGGTGEPAAGNGLGWGPAGVPDVPAQPAGESADSGPAVTTGDGLLSRLAGSAFDPGRAGVRALAAVAAVVVLLAGSLAWWSRPRPEPVVPQLASPAAVALAPTEPAELVVAVTGLVQQPGLVHLPPGSRVADAIEAAGGLLPEADIDHLNLARKLVDGELVAVGVDPPPGETVGAPGVPGSGAKINLNTATLEELQTLPGIGPALAQRIIDFRTEHGAFTSVGQLREVSGIGSTRYAELSDLVTV